MSFCRLGGRGWIDDYFMFGSGLENFYFDVRFGNCLMKCIELKMRFVYL